MEYLVHQPSQLGSALRSRRKSRGLSQADAAAKVGLLPKTVSSLECRSEASSVESLFKLLAALELELVLRPKGEVESDAAREGW